MLLASSGISRDQVTIVNVSPPDMNPVLSNGSVDAVSIWQPNLSVLEAAIPATVSIPYEMPSSFLFVTTRDFADSNADVLGRFLDANSAVDGMLTGDQAQALDLMTGPARIERPLLATMLAGLRLPRPPARTRRLSPSLPMLRSSSSTPEHNPARPRTSPGTFGRWAAMHSTMTAHATGRHTAEVGALSFVDRVVRTNAVPTRERWLQTTVTAAGHGERAGLPPSARRGSAVVRFLRPGGLAAACEMKAAEPGAVALAGGTDVMVQLNFARQSPPALLDISGVAELGEWSRDGDWLRIGAGVPYSRIIDDIGGLAPALTAAARTVGSAQIRNRGTLGGNLGTASPAGDGLPPLVATGSEVEIVSVRGVRTVPVEVFCTGRRPPCSVRTSWWRPCGCPCGAGRSTSRRWAPATPW